MLGLQLCSLVVVGYEDSIDEEFMLLWYALST